MVVILEMISLEISFRFLNEQLQAKDEQIKNLQTIIYNRDTKLLETTNKHWWQFWK